jgi:hypothetical protein
VWQQLQLQPEQQSRVCAWHALVLLLLLLALLLVQRQSCCCPLAQV